MTSDPVVPRLRVVTRPVAPPASGEFDLTTLADPSEPLVWIRGDRGCVGIGEALRLRFSGADRFTNAAECWRGISAAAEIEDPVRMPGSGLVALGAFAFADDSAAESVMIVPQLLIAQHREQWWITEVTQVHAGTAAGAGNGPAPNDPTPNDPAPSEPALPHPAPVGRWRGTEFSASAVAGAAGSATSVSTYLDGVREAVRRIDLGEFEKIVLARQIEGSIGAGDDLREPLSRLAKRYLDCWTFAVDGLVGASPETLIRSTGGAISARVLAGTRGRHAADASRDARARDELLTSAKEQHEHAFAVQSVVTALSPYVRDLRTSEEPFPLRLPNVWHLATDLGAALGEQSTAIELVGALHPTAAVAGTPQVEAVAAIAELEPFDRGRYSGTVGWIDAAGDGEWVIALRCAQVAPVDPGSTTRAVVASAGGGIVEGSDSEHELGETVSKFRPITEAFGP